MVRHRLGRCAVVAGCLLIAGPAGAEVPLALAHGYPMVPVLVAGQQQSFVLDTGAEGSAVYPAFARALNLPVAETETLVGQTGSAELPNRVIASLTLDGTVAGPISATELPARRDGLPIPGIVGLDVVGKRLLDLDVPRHRMALLDGAAADAVVHGLGRPVAAIRVMGGLLAVPVVLDGVSGWGVIDTGARETRVNTAFARSAGLVADDTPATSVNGATQNPVAVTSARVRHARFLGRTRRRTGVKVVDLPVFASFGLADRPAMLLGIDWIAAYRLLIDFRTGSVWLR